MGFLSSTLYVEYKFDLSLLSMVCMLREWSYKASKAKNYEWDIYKFHFKRVPK